MWGKIDDVISHLVRQPFGFLTSPSKMFFSETAEQMKVKLYRNDLCCMSGFDD